MVSKIPIICVALLAILAVLHSPAAAAGDDEAGQKIVEKRTLLIPFANPLKGFDANTISWYTSTQLLVAGGNYLAEKAGLARSTGGRLVHLSMMFYFNHASRYYSHEVAHQFFIKQQNQHFWIDLSDWSHLVPKFVCNQWTDCWADGELERYTRSRDDDPQIIKWFALMAESGLYQEKINSRFVARAAAMSGHTHVDQGVSFILNHIGDFTYNLILGDEPIGLESSLGYTRYIHNDINAYIDYMGDLDIVISRDDWLWASALAFFASGQTWNSARAVCRYLASGEVGVGNISILSDEEFSVQLPNFYIFPSVRGLYMETELLLSGLFKKGDGFYLGLGTGLDSFGADRTGPVDRVRIGGEYREFDISISSFGAKFSPFCYLNFNRNFEHRGHSAGAILQVPVGGRLFLRAKFEHNSGDMMEQVIKNKEEGFEMLAALGVDL